MSVNGKIHDAGGRPRTWLRQAVVQIAAGLRHLVREPRSRVVRPTIRSIVIWASGILLAFVLLTIVFDAAAIIASRRLPGLVVYAFDEITDFGKSGWFLYPLGALIIAIVVAPPNLPRSVQLTLAAIMVRAGFLFIAIGLPGLFTTIVKRMIGRARPFVGGVADPYLYQPFIWRVEYASLPSGHATTAFAAAVAIGTLWPRTRLVMWIYAAVIAVSRVVIVAHHPSDVLAGAVVGIVGALLVRNYFAARQLAFGVAPNGVVAAFVGPSRRRIKAVARALLAA